MLTTDDDGVRDRVLHLRDHGRPPGDRAFQNTQVAFKYKMSAVQAALGVAQMEKVDALIARKRSIFEAYHTSLSRVPDLALNVEPAGTRNGYWMTTVVPGRRWGAEKFAMQAAMRERGVDTRPFFSRLSTLEAYRMFDDAKRALPADPNGRWPAHAGLNLPSGPNLAVKDVKIVCEALKDALASLSA